MTSSSAVNYCDECDETGVTCVECREDALAATPTLTAKFGCDHEPECEFRCYPEDGACACGVHKHHVHVTCGAIVQVG